MSVVAVVLGVWFLVSTVVGLIVGRFLSLTSVTCQEADRREKRRPVYSPKRLHPAALAAQDD